MPAPVFFDDVRALTLTEICEHAGASKPANADSTLKFASIRPLDEAGPSDLSYFDNTRYVAQLAATKAGFVIVSHKHAARVPHPSIALPCSDASAAYARCLAAMFPSATRPTTVFGTLGVSPTAHIHPDARLEHGVVVDPGAVIGPGAEVGGPDDCNAANTGAMMAGADLLALWEGGSPVRMDPETLETRGFTTFRRDLAQMPFSAHPRVVPDGSVWNFGGGGRNAAIWRYSGRKSWPHSEMQWASSIATCATFHSFSLSRNVGAISRSGAT